MEKSNKLLVTVVLAVIGVFVIYQLYSAFYNPVSTETVTQYTATDGVNITGVIIRDEEFINYSSSGSLHFNVQDSERVAKDGVIADVYNNESQSVAATRVAEIENEIAGIEEIQKYNDTNAVDITLLNTKMYADLNTINARCSTGKYSELTDETQNLLTLINRKQIATGQAVDFSAQLTALKSELETQKAAVGTPSGYIKAQNSGYFVSVTDGYEKVLTTDKLSQITPEFLDNLKPQETDSTVMGKLVSNYIWYIAASVSVNDSMQFKTGDTLTIKTALKSNPEITAQVYGINMSAADNRAVVIFMCTEMSGELSSIRSGAMTVVRNTYTGLMVDSKALRVVNKEVTDSDGNTETKSVTGVYVVSGMSASFVPVNILYADKSDTFVICEYLTDDGNLKLYDEIIVKGKNIYDGKIID